MPDQPLTSDRSHCTRPLWRQERAFRVPSEMSGDVCAGPAVSVGIGIISNNHIFFFFFSSSLALSKIVFANFRFLDDTEQL